MSAQPEALRIANALNREWHNDALNYDTALAAADELRRLHAENERLSGICEDRGKTVNRLFLLCREWSHRMDKSDALLGQALESIETDAWQKKLQAAIDIKRHLENGS